MVFKPRPCRSRWEGLAVVSWIALIDVALLAWLVRRPPDGISLVLTLVILASVPLLIHLGQRTLGAFNLEYWLDRNAVTVRWGTQRQIIPLAAIRRVVNAETIPGGVEELGGRHWTAWPSPFVRPTRATGLINLRMMASRGLTTCVLLDTGESGFFALSPVNNEVFIDALMERASLGPTVADERVRLERPRLCQQVEPGTLLDRPSKALLSLGLAGLVILFGTLLLAYPGLPDTMAIHYNRAGIPDLVRSKSSLFVLPVIATLAYFANGAWGILLACRDQRTGSYLLWSGSIIVEIFSLLALVSLLG